MIVKEFNELEISRRKQMAQIIDREVSYTMINKAGKSQKVLLVITSVFGIAILLIIKMFANSKKVANDKFNKLLLKLEEKALQQNDEKDSRILAASFTNDIHRGKPYRSKYHHYRDLWQENGFRREGNGFTYQAGSI